MAVRKLTKLVQHHPQFHSKLEEMLQDLYSTLEPEVSAVIRKEENEDSCPIFKLSNDELKLVFGYAGENQYGFVACASDRFIQVYLDTFGGERLTSIESAAVSASRAQLCLGTEMLNGNTHASIATKLFQASAKNGQLEVLKWGQGSGYELNLCWRRATLQMHGHLEVVKYLRKLGIPWDQWTCTNAAGGGHLKSLKCRRSNQCPWDEETCFEAAWKGHLHYFKLYGSVMTLVQGVFRVYRTYRVGTSFIYLTKHFLQTLDLIIFNLYCII